MNTKMKAFRDTVGQMAVIFIIASVIGYLSKFLTMQIVAYLGLAFAIGITGYLMYTYNLTSLEMKEKYKDGR